MPGGTGRPPHPPGSSPLLYTLLLSIVPLIAISIIVLIIVFIWRSYRLAGLRGGHSGATPPHGGHGGEPQLLLPPGTPSPRSEPRHMAVRKIELKARGRFGTVWKAQMVGPGPNAGTLVAIKVRRR